MPWNQAFIKESMYWRYAFELQCACKARSHPPQDMPGHVVAQYRRGLENNTPPSIFAQEFELGTKATIDGRSPTKT